MKILELKNVTFRRGGKQILSDVNVTLAQGKIVGLFGANGTGKTTLLRLISGLTRGYRGEIKVAGKTNEVMRKAQLAYTGDLAGFNGGTTIKRIAQVYAGLFPDFKQEKFNQMLKDLALEPKLKLRELSQGMHAKLLVALTLARQVPLYLLDEPFNGIDLMSRKKILKLILLWKEPTATIVITEHIVEEIADILDEVVIIKDHQIVAHQATEVIRGRGQSVADYYEGFYEGEVK